MTEILAGTIGKCPNGECDLAKLLCKYGKLELQPNAPCMKFGMSPEQLPYFLHHKEHLRPVLGKIKYKSLLLQNKIGKLLVDRPPPVNMDWLYVDVRLILEQRLVPELAEMILQAF